MATFITLEIIRSDDDRTTGDIDIHTIGSNEESRNDKPRSGEYPAPLTWRRPTIPTSTGPRRSPAYTTQTASPRSSVSDTTNTPGRTTTARKKTTTHETAVPTTGTSQTEESSTATGPSAGDLIAAELINASLNWNYNPCDDFYRFVCSRFEGGIDALYKLTSYTKRAIREVLSATVVPRKGQSATQKAAGMYQACVNLGSDKKNPEAQLPWLKSFLFHLGLDPSNMESHPGFDVADRIAQLSLVYGLPTFVKFGVFEKPARSPEYSLYVAIHKEDEEWMQYNFLAYGNVRRLKAFYEAKLLLYDSNLDTSTLGDRIIRAENIVRGSIEAARRGSPLKRHTTVERLGFFVKNYVTAAQWERLITGHTNHTFRPKDSIQLLDNATTVLALLTVDSILARDDSRLLVAWSLLHRLLPLAHGQEMRRTKSASPNKGASIEEFCYEKVAGVMGLAVSKKYFNSVIPPATMDAAARLAMDVMRALVQKLNTTFWIRDPVRSLVLSKAEIMGLVVGFPVEYSDQSALDAAFGEHRAVMSTSCTLLASSRTRRKRACLERWSCLERSNKMAGDLSWVVQRQIM
ncbi:uncharacterized protein LOC144134325 [Amblyomma americanum]